MKKVFSLFAFALLMFSGWATSAGAATNGNNGHQGYSGTGGTNGFTSSTGLVKERNDEQNHMDGKSPDDDTAAMDADEDAPEGASTEDAAGGKKDPKGSKE